jgi:hypothetical protein
MNYAIKTLESRLGKLLQAREDVKALLIYSFSEDDEERHKRLTKAIVEHREAIELLKGAKHG